MIKFLVVRCTTYDLAGVAMITGAVNGFQELGAEIDLRILVADKDYTWHASYITYVDPRERKEAFKWADVILDIGGVCKGFGSRLSSYIQTAKNMKIPYVYMSQSFIDPDPRALEVDAIIARGPRSAEAVEKASGKKVSVGADLGFLVNPRKIRQTNYSRGFTTYQNRDLSGMRKQVDWESIQVIWKKDKGHQVFEPRLGLDEYISSVEHTFGFISTLKEVHTARYHAGVAAILAGIDLQVYPFEGNKSKYTDLLSFRSLSPNQLKLSALSSCIIALEVANGS